MYFLMYGEIHGVSILDRRPLDSCRPICSVLSAGKEIRNIGKPAISFSAALLNTSHVLQRGKKQSPAGIRPVWICYEHASVPDQSSGV